MDSCEIIEELQFNDRWLTDEYKNSKEYLEYLDQINKDLKSLYNEN